MMGKVHLVGSFYIWGVWNIRGTIWFNLLSPGGAVVWHVVTCGIPQPPVPRSRGCILGRGVPTRDGQNLCWGWNYQMYYGMYVTVGDEMRNQPRNDKYPGTPGAKGVKVTIFISTIVHRRLLCLSYKTMCLIVGVEVTSDVDCSTHMGFIQRW